ncbi:unnamed protein product [Candidula unifasciata]|uniref:Serine racemase n=1 Tax=Candidula unifasciata TaxID=100452 RepID=A0A8S3ZNP9_9EUPU|nr:unnamed protein product [Candidula unifasciata]
MAAEGGVSLDDVKKAFERVSPFIHRTPVFTSSQADVRSGRSLFFKAENLQKTGAFKVRGALNSIIKARETRPDIKGFTTFSSGNHGQAMAWACQLFALPCYVVVPSTASEVKKNAIRGYGAEVVECGPKPSDRNETCEQVRKEKNLEVIPPFDHPDVIAGQGTLGLELLEQVPDIDAILVGVSGGGLSSGIAVAVKALKPSVKIFLVTPKGKNLAECLKTGKRPWENPPQYLNTIIDAMRLQQSGFLTTPILIEKAEKEVFEMSDEEVIAGMKFGFERLKLTVEAASGATIAAALSDRFRSLDPTIRKVAVILSGGNVEINNLPW